MKKIIVSLAALMIAQTLFSQNLSVFDVDASAYPTVSAKFYAWDTNGDQITNLSAADFEVTEDGQPRTVTYVSCPPPVPPQALSSVLTIDVSGSMAWTED